MSITVPIDTAQQDLQNLLDRLHFGETVTLVSAAGTPEALLVSLRSGADVPRPVADWDAQWDALTNKISQAWKGDKSAVDILTEMRR
jgi:antitoxin (DNA-binding transcriptional repressor) of toxin-antitoxin stability system